MTDQITTPSGLKYEDTEPGTGAIARAGQKAKVHYTGWLKNGQKFDSSLDRNDPFEFTLGAGMVIKGWDEGVVGDEGGREAETDDTRRPRLRRSRSWRSDTAECGVDI